MVCADRLFKEGHELFAGVSGSDSGQQIYRTIQQRGLTQLKSQRDAEFRTLNPHRSSQ